MALRLKYSDDGTVQVLRDGEDESIDPRTIDWRAGEQPLTVPQMRARLAAVQQALERPRSEAFETFLRFGRRGLTDEMRAQTTVTAGGGYTIQGSYEKDFIAAMKQFDPILGISTNFETPTGAAGDYPVDDDVLSGRIVAESGQATETDVTVGTLPLVKAPKHGSDIVRVSIELLQDAYTVFDTLVSPVLSRRLARSVAATAVARLLTDADTSVTAASTTVVLPSEILDLMAAVDPAHSQVGVFLMNEATLTSLKKFTAYTAGYYPNMIGTDPQGRATVFGKAVFSSPSMPALGAGNKAVAFGNFKRFYVRTVALSLVLMRYDERYAEFAQAGFQMFWRAQGALAKSTNTPVAVRLLACHS